MNGHGACEPEPTAHHGHCDWTDERPNAPAARLPDLPDGTHLALAPYEWYPRVGVRGQAELHLWLVDAQPLNTELAWVRGHGLECSWDSSDCDLPWCREILVTIRALHRAAGGA
ncbi:hypothetical protein AB0J86_36460 [Micromonospora sp. NPDC049559]|uniref:hypothetical protein n=1 Tax=Micromonospora sp. NPDC049559 TaxID=3155923 RepID=UPI0034124F66